MARIMNDSDNEAAIATLEQAPLSPSFPPNGQLTRMTDSDADSDADPDADSDADSDDGGAGAGGGGRGAAGGGGAAGGLRRVVPVAGAYIYIYIYELNMFQPLWRRRRLSTYAEHAKTAASRPLTRRAAAACAARRRRARAHKPLDGLRASVDRFGPETNGGARGAPSLGPT